MIWVSIFLAFFGAIAWLDSFRILRAAERRLREARDCHRVIHRMIERGAFRE